MRRIGRNIAKEGFVFGFIDKAHAFAEQYIRAIAGKSRGFAVFKIGVIKVVVAPSIACIAYAASGVVNRPIETAIMRAIWCVVP